MEPIEETIEETEMVVEDEEEAEVEKLEEAVAVVEVAVAESDETTKRREEEAQAHSRGLSQTNTILLMNMLPSRPKIYSNSLKFEMQETSLERECSCNRTSGCSNNQRNN